MLKIDVDVRSLVSFATNEAFEEQIVLLWIYAGDTQAITDRTVRCRPSPLAQNAPGSRKPHQIPDRQEIGLVPKLFDQLHLVLEHLHDPHRHPFGIPFLGSRPGQLFQVFDRGNPLGRPLARILITKRIQRERDLRCNVDCVGNRFWAIPILSFDLIQRPHRQHRVPRPKSRNLVDGGASCDGA